MTTRYKLIQVAVVALLLPLFLSSAHCADLAVAIWAQSYTMTDETTIYAESAYGDHGETKDASYYASGPADNLAGFYILTHSRPPGR